MPRRRTSARPRFGVIAALLVLFGFAGVASAEFSEAVRDRLGRTLGYLQPSGDRIYVQDRCFTRLGWVIQDGMNKGTYSPSGQKLAQSPMPYMLLSKPSRSCPSPVPQ